MRKAKTLMRKAKTLMRKAKRNFEKDVAQKPQNFLVICPQQIEDKGRCWTIPCQCEG